MRKKIAILIVVILIGVGLTPFAISSNACFADEDSVGTNASTFYLNTENGGELLINLVIENRLNRPIDVDIANWHNYAHPDETQTWIEPEWLKSITPESITLPIGGQTIANIVYDIPEEAPEVKYITWIKIDTQDWEKPITVIIRKGEAAKDIEFAVSPSYFKVSVKTGATKTYTNWQDITVINKCGSELLAYPIAEGKVEPLEITASSSIKHTSEEVGTVYQNIPTKQAQEWFDTNHTKDNPLAVGANSRKGLPWGLEIPNDIKNGHYVFGIRIASANEKANSININYVVWVLLDIDRTKSNSSLPSWLWIFLGLGGGIVGVIAITEVRRRVNFRFARD